MKEDMLVQFRANDACLFEKKQSMNIRMLQVIASCNQSASSRAVFNSRQCRKAPAVVGSHPGMHGEQFLVLLHERLLTIGLERKQRIVFTQFVNHSACA
jgi:hypothetical protein